MWVIGDWLLAGEQKGYLPRGKLREACEIFGIEISTARNAALVCRQFERSLRKDDLTFTHHAFAATKLNVSVVLNHDGTGYDQLHSGERSHGL